jgi:hypothetical protein
MRIVGKSELHALARTKERDLRDAVLAFSAELEAANWCAIEDARLAFPQARFAEHRLTIDLDERHCVMVALNIEVGIAAVEFAGPSTSTKRQRSAP